MMFIWLKIRWKRGAPQLAYAVGGDVVGHGGAGGGVVIGYGDDSSEHIVGVATGFASGVGFGDG